MKKVKKILLHIGGICSCVLIIVHILDWYNPFMDFSGYSLWVLYLLCAVMLIVNVLDTAFDSKKF